MSSDEEDTRWGDLDDEGRRQTIEWHQRSAQITVSMHQELLEGRASVARLLCILGYEHSYHKEPRLRGEAKGYLQVDLVARAGLAGNGAGRRLRESLEKLRYLTPIFGRGHRRALYRFYPYVAGLGGGVEELTRIVQESFFERPWAWVVPRGDVFSWGFGRKDDWLEGLAPVVAKCRDEILPVLADLLMEHHPKDPVMPLLNGRFLIFDLQRMAATLLPDSFPEKHLLWEVIEKRRLSDGGLGAGPGGGPHGVFGGRQKHWGKTLVPPYPE